MKVTINKNCEITADVDSDSDIAMLRKLASFGDVVPKAFKQESPEPILFQTPVDPLEAALSTQTPNINDPMLRLDLSKLPLRFHIGDAYKQIYGRSYSNIMANDLNGYFVMRDILRELIQSGRIRQNKKRGKTYLNLSIAQRPVIIEQHEPERPMFEPERPMFARKPYKPTKLFKGYKDLIGNVFPQMPESFGMRDIYKKVFGLEYNLKHKRDSPEDIQANNNYGNLYAALRRCVRSGSLSVRPVFLPTSYGTKVKHNIYTKITKLSEDHKLYTITPEEQSPTPKPYLPEASVPEAGEDITYADIPVIDTKVMRSILDTYDSIDANAFNGFRTKNGTPADSTSAQYAFRWIEEHLSAINRLIGRNFAIRGAGGYKYLEALK